MSYDLEFLPRENETKQEAETGLRTVLAELEHCTLTENQFWFEKPGIDDGPVGDFAGENEDAEDDLDYEYPGANAFAWININYFRSPPYYDFCGEVIAKVLNEGGFDAYDPQTNEILKKPFDAVSFSARLNTQNEAYGTPQEFMERFETKGSWFSRLRKRLRF
ncbi:hypothetical protein [Halovulum sp. GXIMD14793]